MTDLVKEWVRDLGDKRRLLTVPEGRRALTKMSFYDFCFIYFRGVMQSPDTGGKVSLSDFHEAFIDDARRYVKHAGPAESRTAWVCPRGAGKSTMLMMLVIWLMAHQHQRFITIFSATANQAEDMLSNIRSQFDNNELLRKDYAGLVRPATRKMEKLKLSDNKQLMMQQNGSIMSARSITSQVLGMRIDNTRPSVIILDDIEKGEVGTSSTDVAKLLVTLQDDIFPLSINAHVAMVGTTTRPGGLTEDLVHKALDVEHGDWVEQENFRVNYFPAMTTDDHGNKRSMWPERWSTEWLVSQEGTRSYAKNFLCLPSPDDFEYWTPDDFQYGTLASHSRRILSVDPAVTTKKSSDETAVAVVSYSANERKACVEFSRGYRLKGEPFRQEVLRVLEQFPDIQEIWFERNQGGDTMAESVLHDMPVPVRTHHASEKKEIRMERLLSYYRRGAILHAKKFRELENQMMQFPHAPHDDLPDAVGHAVDRLATPIKRSTLKTAVR